MKSEAGAQLDNSGACPPIQFGASEKDADLRFIVNEGPKADKEALTEGLASAPREWELLPPPPASHRASPEMLPGRFCDARPFSVAPATVSTASCLQSLPAESSMFSGERGQGQRLYPELFYGNQVPTSQLESQLHGTSGASNYHRPSTPSLHTYRSQHLYLQPSPGPASPAQGAAGAVLSSSALLSGVALKGQYVEISALQAAELPKLPATGLLYQAPPPSFIYSSAFCGSQLPPEQAMLQQMRQELASPSEYYPATLGQGSQSNFLTATGPAQQVLLPVVEPPQLSPVVNFGSLQQAPPTATAPPPPPMPLVPMATQALRPPGQMPGRLMSPAVRAFPHGGVGRSELHALEMKPLQDYRKLNGLGAAGARPPSGGRPFSGGFNARLKSPASGYGSIFRAQRFEVYQQSDVRWSPRAWERAPQPRDGAPPRRLEPDPRSHSDKQDPSLSSHH
nr:protein PRRC2A-like isoform X1 [Anolis sagrei ordinatus]